MKKTFYCEAAYAVGIVFLALGSAVMARADFGMSMVVAPAYLLHLKISQYLSFYTFGMSEYVLQAVLLIAMTILLGRFKKSSLFSFVTAVIYGFTLDGLIALIGLIPFGGSLPERTVYYLIGLLACGFGVACLFHTYLPPEAYELFVKEISAKYGTDIHKTKTIYDCVSCLAGVILSFAFFGFGRFEGVKWGTIVCAAVNGWLISRFSKWMEPRFDFKAALPALQEFMSR